jgi:hypothetical protein
MFCEEFFLGAEEGVADPANHLYRLSHAAFADAASVGGWALP